MATVLIVDDDEAYCLALSIALEDRGHTTIAVPNAERALYEYSRHLIDVAVIDVRLPGLNGTAIMRMFRRLTSMPIVAVSGGDAGTESAARSAGADAYLQKPVPTSELDAVVEDLLHGARRTRAPRLRAGAFEVGLPDGPVSVHGHPVKVSGAAARVFAALIAPPLCPRSADQLRQAAADATEVETCIDELHRAVEPNPARPVHIVPVAGGYEFHP